MQRLSRETENEFMEYHMTKVWNELHDRFGFDTKKWKEKFNNYLLKHPRDVSEVSVFYRFGHDEINPVLNMILCRSHLHPTFNKLIEYVVRKAK